MTPKRVPSSSLLPVPGVRLRGSCRELDMNWPILSGHEAGGHPRIRTGTSHLRTVRHCPVVLDARGDRPGLSSGLPPDNKPGRVVSYTVMVEPTGIEPVTSPVRAECSTQHELRPQECTNEMGEEGAFTASCTTRRQPHRYGTGRIRTSVTGVEGENSFLMARAKGFANKLSVLVVDVLTTTPHLPEGRAGNRTRTFRLAGG